MENWIEQGATDEESGDRWLGSDLAKSLRFFQKAYTSYLQAAQMPRVASSTDAIYNASRLLFHVYTTYIKPNCVILSDLENVHDAIAGGDSAVVQPLPSILEAHESALLQLGLDGTPPLDLIYNTALVYTEAIETAQFNDVSFDKVLEMGSRAQRLLVGLLDTQVSTLQKFVRDLLQLEEVLSTVDGDVSEFESSETLQPSDVFDTVLSAYRLVYVTLDNIAEPHLQTPRGLDLVQPFLNTINLTHNDLLGAYLAAINSNDMLEAISQLQAEESECLKCAITGCIINDLIELTSLWEAPVLPHTAERFLMTADSFQSFLDRNDADAPEIVWQALTKMGVAYKSAQELLQHQRQQASGGQEQAVGSLVAQISDIMVARSDIDLQRSLMASSYEPAAQHRRVLFANCQNFLKNASTLASQSGGLRERALEKQQRHKSKIDAVLRLCILEGKTSVGELDAILGRSRWVSELPNLVRMGYFRQFGIDLIEIPRAIATVYT